MRLLFLPLLLLACLASGLRAEPRLWRDTGGRTVNGTYITANDEHVFLRLDTGKTSEIPLGLLSNRDLEFVRGKRASLGAQGILTEMPLVWESYRSKKFTSAQAEKLGYFPLESNGSDATLRLIFRRYGPPPAPEAKLVLRLHVSPARGAGTTSAIRVSCGDKVVGTAHGAPDGQSVDIPINASLLAKAHSIELVLQGGSDAVFLRSKASGRGSQLVVLK